MDQSSQDIFQNSYRDFSHKEQIFYLETRLQTLQQMYESLQEAYKKLEDQNRLKQLDPKNLKDPNEQYEKIYNFCTEKLETNYQKDKKINALNDENKYLKTVNQDLQNELDKYKKSWFNMLQIINKKIN